MSTTMLRPGVFLLGIGVAAGCQPYATLVDVPVDCSVEDGYEFQTPMELFEMVGAAGWWTQGDDLATAGGVTATVDPIAEGARCGSHAALVLRSSHANDWGTLFGFNNFGPRDESAYEGMSFWARAPGNTTKGFTILLDDPNTATVTTGGHCKDYSADGGVDGGNSGQMTGTIVDQNGNVISGTSTAQPLPDQCGNSYSKVLTVTTGWRFYTLPFTQFTQGPTPNRVPNEVLTETGTVAGTGLLTSALQNLVLRMPKEAVMELWIDNLSFYRKTGAPAAAVADAGALMDGIPGQ